MPFSSQQKKSPRKQTRLKERECVCASVAFVSAQQQQQLLLKNAKKKSLLTFRVYNPNARNWHSLLYKNFIRESARENLDISPAREYQNDVVFIALLDFNPILESFDVIFDVQRDE